MMKILPLLILNVWLVCAACVAQSATAEEAEVTALDTAAVVTAPSDTLTFAFCGDIMMGTRTAPELGGTFLPPNDGKNLFDGPRDILARVDVAAGNLEGSLLDGVGTPRPMRNPKTYFVFKMPEAYVGNLVDAGFDFLGNANNHINDFGAEGRRTTLATLDKAGIANAGLRGVNEWSVIERKGRRIAFTQFGHGANNLDVTDLGELRRVVKAMKDTADIVVVSFHGGAEGTAYTHVPGKMEIYLGERRGNVREFAHAAIDAGAHIVFGHGPHVPRAAELYNGHIIFYSLGNFCTPYRMGINGVSGYAPLAEVAIDVADGTFLNGRIHSFIQQRGKGPVPDSGNRVAAFMREMSREDFPASKLRIDSDGTLSAE